MKYQKKILNKVKCLICPRECTLKEGQKGFCRVRENKSGEIISTTYGLNTGLSLDPIEKKPLYHFLPNSKILSFGTFGCILGCRFCQNFHLSRGYNEAALNKVSPENIVQIALQNNIKSVAFTYNDPIAFFEYAIQTAKLCREAGIKTVAVTSGYINREAAVEFFDVMDACNIDLKGFSEKFYSKNCLAHLKPVLDTIKYVTNETKCHVELTTLLIENENTDTIKSEINWILENLGDLVPLHFSAFFPKYKFLDKPATSFETLYNARKLAIHEGLKYVYTGNLANLETSSTYCKNCKAVLIERGCEIKINLKNGCCPHCGTKADIII